MRKELYFEPAELPMWTVGLLILAIVLFLLLMVVWVASSLLNGNFLFAIAIAVALVLAVFAVFRSWSESEYQHDPDEPMLIFDEAGFCFNHQQQGFTLQWVDLTHVDVRLGQRGGIDAYVIHTKTDEWVLHAHYLQNSEGINAYEIFKQYAVKYGGKPLLL